MPVSLPPSAPGLVSGAPPVLSAPPPVLSAPPIPQALSSTSLRSIPQVPSQPVTVAPPTLPPSVPPPVPANFWNDVLINQSQADVNFSNVPSNPPLPPPSIPQGLTSTSLGMPASSLPMRSQTVPRFEFFPETTNVPMALGPPSSSSVEDRGVLFSKKSITSDTDPLLHSLDSANVPGKGEFYGATGRPLDSMYMNPPNENWRDYVQESKKQEARTIVKKARYGFYHSSVTNYCSWWSILVLLPWMIFTVTVASLVFAYHRHALSVGFLVLLFLALAVLFAVVGVTNRRNSFSFPVLGALCAFAAFSGCLAGLWGYHKVAAQYYLTDESRTYTDVLPGEPAVAHADAGTLIFSTDARVDMGRVVGYKSAGAVYCVAPILKKADMVTSRVEYWAAGTDCCHARTAFSCGNSWGRNARTGLVLPEALPSKSWLFPGSREQYLKAAQEAAGVYGLLLGEEPLFVTWVQNIPDTRREMWHYILLFVFAASAIYFCFACVCAFITYLADRPLRKKKRPNYQEEIQEEVQVGGD